MNADLHTKARARAHTDTHEPNKKTSIVMQKTSTEMIKTYFAVFSNG